MEVEKRGSRGGFFQIFDWNRKSRKKLFLNNIHLSGTFSFLVHSDSEYLFFCFHLSLAASD